MSFLYIIPWVLSSVLIGVYLGYTLGKGNPRSKPETPADEDRVKVMRAVMSMLDSAERLAGDVGSHNSELLQVGREVVGLQLPEEMEDVQRVIVTKISNVIQSNRRLEDDLVCTRFQLERQAQELDRTRHEARVDALSGAGNRKAFDEMLQYLLSHYHREQMPFALLLLDVDHFKWINDTHGHAAGDMVVQNLSGYLKTLVRVGDDVFRFGGDEFAILLNKLEGEIARTVADRIRQAIARHNFGVGSGGERVAVTCSLGLACVAAEDTAETLFVRADEALYRSKRGGRNQTNSDEVLPATDTVSIPAEEAAPEAKLQKSRS